VSRILALPVSLLVVALVAVACASSDTIARGHGVFRAATSLPGDPGDTARPTIRKLDADLRDAVEAAARAARKDGVTVIVNSGWRSRAHQERLFREAVSRYGSEAEALRYVATPETSAHVTGDAVDIGPEEADEWLREHGADYGLCQVFANEIWHFELATTPGGTCPPMYPDSSYRG
jgi:LAS superfamily LD-carboxypeptidase LdcB